MPPARIVYLGGGSTRAPGTVAAFVEQAVNFAGSEVVLVDLDPARLELVARLARKMVEARRADLQVSFTTNREKALDGADAVLSSFRPGGFEARRLDERIPLEHGVIGQETQGPGGFFMALRSIHVLKAVCAEIERLCPGAMLFNYTNPVNVVAQAVSLFSPVPVVSLCEGPIIFPREVARYAGLDPDRVRAEMVGLNHACWSTRATYDGEDIMPLLDEALGRVRDDPTAPADARRLLEIATTMRSLPASYMKYYFHRDELLAELRAKPTTRAEDILAAMPSYWRHYEEQAGSGDPRLEPSLSRGGIFELELAVNVMASWLNDRGEVWPVNVPNHGALPGFPDDRVVEVYGVVDRSGVRPVSSQPPPPPVRGLVGALGEYQDLAAQAAWQGEREDGVRALAANPLVPTLRLARELYAALSAAHAEYLPARLR